MHREGGGGVLLNSSELQLNWGGIESGSRRSRKRVKKGGTDDLIMIYITSTKDGEREGGKDGEAQSELMTV